ncbi:g6036 [Coccomyxa elongata]
MLTLFCHIFFKKYFGMTRQKRRRQARILVSHCSRGCRAIAAIFVQRPRVDIREFKLKRNLRCVPWLIR